MNYSVEEMPPDSYDNLYLVETISIHRIRYVVKTKNPVYAEDTVVMNEAKEFSQKHIDEIIISTREITHEEYLRLFDQDNDYLSHWTVEKKKQYITTPQSKTTDTEMPTLQS
jgi:predicted ATPase